MKRFHDLSPGQAMALYLYNPKIVRLAVELVNTSDPQSTAVFQYAGDFDGACRKDKKVADCYNRAMTMIYGEAK